MKPFVNKNNIHFVLFFCFSLVISFVLIQAVFWEVMRSETAIVSKNINNFFLDHKVIVNPYHIAQSLSDYESFGMLRCSKLIKVEKNSREIVFLDLSFKGGCKHSLMSFNGMEIKEVYLSGNGNSWRFESFFNASQSIRSLFWTLRILAIIFIALAIASYRSRIIAIDRKAQMRALKDKQRAEIMQDLAHDIKNPLAVLELVTGVKTWEDFMNWKPEMTRAITRVHAILADFRKETDSVSLNIVADTLDLTSITSDANKTLGSDKVEITSESESDGRLLKIDRIAIERAVINLINNAAEALATSIVVSSKVTGHDLVISVKDNGTGVPVEIAKSLFQRGQSFGKPGGQGIGLYNVKRIGEGHDGSVRYYRLSEHSVFELYLPRCVIAAEEANKNPFSSSQIIESPTQNTVLVAINEPSRQHGILEHLAKYPVKIQLENRCFRSVSIVLTNDHSMIDSYLLGDIPIVLDNGKDTPEKVARQIVRRLRGMSDIKSERNDEI
jgi:signal transduction histidine kinase